MMMMTTPEPRHYPVVESVIDMFARWLKHRRDIAETCNCGSEEFAHIAHDLNISTSELDQLVRRGAHATAELPKLLAPPANWLRRQSKDVQRADAPCDTEHGEKRTQLVRP